jgi:hypothetical protein
MCHFNGRPQRGYDYEETDDEEEKFEDEKAEPDLANKETVEDARILTDGGDDEESE